MVSTTTWFHGFVFGDCNYKCCNNLDVTINYKPVKNPGYMKENFMICIESLHIADTGEQDNVR